MDGTFTDLTTSRSLTHGSITTMTASVGIVGVLFWHGVSDTLHLAFKPNSTNVRVSNLWCNGSDGISVGSLGQVSTPVI
jgi:hypothetical protein